MNYILEIDAWRIINYIMTSQYFLSSIIIVSFFVIFILISKCRSKKSVRKCSIILIAITAVAGFILYLIGYMQNNNNDIFLSCLRAIFSTARMFLLDDDYSVIKDGAANDIVMKSIWYVSLFWAVHVIALLSSIFTILTLFGRRIIERIILFFKFNKTIHIIFGANSRSLCFVENLLLKKNRIIIVIDEKADEFFSEKIQNLGAIIVKERIFDRGIINDKLLKKVGLLNKKSRNKTEVFLFEDEESYNINLAREIIKIANEREIKSDKLRLFIESNDKIILRDIENVINNGTIKYIINIISEAQLAARGLMEDCPIIDTIDIDASKATVTDSTSNFTILIIGFGEIGREVLLNGICNGQFISSDKKPLAFNAIIVDQQCNNKLWKFKNMYPAIENEYTGIEYISLNADNVEFEKLLHEKIKEINYICIATENDIYNLELAKNIKHYIDRNKIPWGKRIMAVHMRSQSNFLNQINKREVYKNINFFGDYENIYTEDIIINETMDEIAQKIQEHYNITHNINESWVDSSLFIKNSNRSAAMHLKTKLRLIGYELDDNIEKSVFDKDKLDNYISQEQMENLLHVEHLRWNAFHFTNGWTKFAGLSKDESDKLQSNKENNKCSKLLYKKRKDSKMRWHSCLVSWEKLAEVSKIFCYNDKCDEIGQGRFPNCIKNNRYIDLKDKYNSLIDYQFEDLEQIIRIPEFLDYAKLKVRKINDKTDILDKEDISINISKKVSFKY